MEKLFHTFKLVLVVAVVLPLFGCMTDMTKTWQGRNTANDAAYAAALKKWQPLAEQGDANSQFEIGKIYYYGHGVAQNRQVAAKWYRSAAEQGHTEAQFLLGSYYHNWNYGQRDLDKASKWYQLAAASGHQGAQFSLKNINRQKTQNSNSELPEPSASDTNPPIANLPDPTPNPKTPEVAKTVPIKPKPNSPPTPATSGSGFFVSKVGHVVTNAHVVKDCSQITIGDNVNKQTSAEVISTDNRNDLALLKVSSLSMASDETKSLIRKLAVKVVPLAVSGLLRPEDAELGEKVMVAGYPYGDIFSNTIKVTLGIVSATRGMGDDTGQFQLDAAVQPGNSGGPIYDGKGNILGVVVSQLNKLKVAKAIGSLPENVNFGIKASTVRQFLTASGLPSKWSERSKVMSNKELAKIAEKQALMVMCFQ